MQNRFNNDFEHFVKQNADQYRMFPSDKVWKGIHNTLHTKRRWYGIGLALLLLTTGVVTWVMLVSSNKSKPVATTLPKTDTRLLAVTPKQDKELIAEVVIAPVQSKGTKGNSFTISADEIKENLFIAGTTDKDNMTTVNAIGDITTEPFGEFNSIDYSSPAPVTKVEPVLQPDPTVAVSSVKKTLAADKQLVYNNKVAKPQGRGAAVVNSAVNNKTTVPASNVFTPVIMDSEPEADKKETANSSATKKEETSFFNNMAAPYTIESVINAYRYTGKRKRISLQAYITPTITYRELKENKPYIEYARNAGTGPNSAYYTVDINNVVTHKPDIGLQMGFSAGYPLSKKVKLIGGLQFNISKYDIKAYEGSTEMATITLNNAGGARSVSTLTNYRNVGGEGANWLHNLYFSASAPIGLELKLAGNRKSYVGIAGTLQPTYIISNRSYVISSDYKNYAEVPSLTRRVNLNTGFEIFAGSSTGKVKWRVGPQVRYQAMSSFENKYPVKEHLFDFGLKLGIMLNK